MTEILSGTIKTKTPFQVELDTLGLIPLSVPTGYLGEVGQRIYVLHEGNKYVPLLFGGGGGESGGESEALRSLDFYPYGFKAVYDRTVLNMRWTKDEQGRITRLINQNTGQTIKMGWHDE